MMSEIEEPDREPNSTPTVSSTPDGQGAAGPEEILVRRVAGSLAPYGGRPDPITLAVRDLLAVPRQVLPEATYTHLKNAGREAFLAVVTLFESINSSVNSPHKYSATDKSVKRIDIE